MKNPWVGLGWAWQVITRIGFKASPSFFFPDWAWIDLQPAPTCLSCTPSYVNNGSNPNIWIIAYFVIPTLGQRRVRVGSLNSESYLLKIFPMATFRSYILLIIFWNYELYFQKPFYFIFRIKILKSRNLYSKFLVTFVLPRFTSNVVHSYCWHYSQQNFILDT